MLADRGRKVRMNLGEKAIGPEAVAGVAKLRELGLIRVIPIVGSEESMVYLGDLGEQVVTQMKEQFAKEIYVGTED
jgi:hypothetical protein